MPVAFEAAGDGGRIPYSLALSRLRCGRQGSGPSRCSWPQFGWVAAALALVVLMTIQGLGYLLPTNLWVCIQLRRPDPDLAKISRTMRNYFFAVGAQGTMQVLTIVIMARFVTGL